MEFTLMKGLLLIQFFALLLVTGCAPEIIPFKSSPSITRSYTIGQQATASVGQPMAAVQSQSSAPVYVVTADYTPPQHDPFKGGLDFPALTKGMRFTKVADRSDGVIGIYNPRYQVYIPASLTRKERSEDILLWIEPSGVVSGTMEGKAWTRDPLFMEDHGGTSSYQSELIYNGRTGETINLLFRENINAGSPVTTNLHYNLSEGNMLTVKSMTIEVINATASMVEYRIVSDGDMAWAQ
jgi:hypothetical protein